MKKIAICDDDGDFVATIKEMISEYQVEYGISCSVHVYTQSRDLLKVAQMGVEYDIYILDVVMPDIDGISLGKFLAENQPDSKVLYFSVSKEFAIDAFTVNAFYYMMKPVEKERFYEVFARALQAIPKNSVPPAYIAVDTQDGILAVETSKIMYCVLENRRVRYINRGGRVAVISKMLRVSFASHVESLLEMDNFVQCNAHSVINIGEISKMDADKVIMKNNAEIKISRALKHSLKEKYFKFYFESHN